MNMEHSTDSPVERKLERFRKVCRQQGLRMTHQRLEVFQELVSDPGHPSAEEIFRRVKKRLPMITLDTVYRTVYTFERCGVVRRLQALDDRIRFDSNLEPHHHLVCRRCKRINDLYWPEFETLEVPDGTENWGTIESVCVEVRGLCRQCRDSIEKK